MRLIFALALSLLALSAEATSLKAHYGHYYATDYGDNTTTDIQHLCSTPGITGINYRMRWRELEPTAGNYAFTALDAVVSTIQAMGAATGSGGTRVANNSCRLWVLPEFKLFSAVAGSANPCPSWLTDVNGNPGWAPTTYSTSTIRIATGAASVTNASPIVVTTVSAHGYTTGTQVFIDNVTGNKAANGLWTITVLTPTTFSLQTSHGSGARTATAGTYWGRVTKGGAFICKLWDSGIKTKFQNVIQALGDHFDGSATVEGMILQESATSMTNGTPYVDDSTVGGDYVGATYGAAITSFVVKCGTAFPTSRCLAFLNFIESSQKSLHDVSDALTALSDNQGCYGGPDILPANQGLYGSLDSTYQVLIRHVGCRSNSAQNTTIVGSPTGAAACAALNCDAVFKFTVQGNFGNLGTKATGGKYVLAATDGLCVNSYLFWNDSTAEQLKVNPTVKATPYGVGWYGQCNCGGGAP